MTSLQPGTFWSSSRTSKTRVRAEAALARASRHWVSIHSGGCGSAASADATTLGQRRRFSTWLAAVVLPT